MSKRVLLVDDEMLHNLDTGSVLRQHGYCTDYAASAEACLEKLESGEEAPDIILMDIDFGPGRMDGAEATKHINARYDIPVVLYSAYDDKETLESTREMTRYGYVQKIPGNDHIVLATLDMALKLHRMECREREHREQLRREMRLKEKITQTAPVGIVVADGRGDISFANHEAKRMFALEEGSEVHASGSRRWKITDIAGQPLRGPALPFEEVRRTGSPVYDERRAIHRPDGDVLYLSINATPLADDESTFSGMVAAIRDITAEHLQNRRVEKNNRILKMLSETNQYLVRTHNEQELLGHICRIITDTGGYPLAWVGFIGEDRDQRVEPVVSAGKMAEYPNIVRICWSDDALGASPEGRAVRTGSCIVAHDVPQDPNFDPWRVEVHRRGFSGVVALPLIVNGAVIGGLNIYSGEGAQFDPEELSLLQQLTEDLSYGLSFLRTEENRRLMEEALHKSEIKYRNIFNNSNDAILLHGISRGGWPGKFLEVNDVACRMLGYSRQELFQFSPFEIDTKASVERGAEIMGKLKGEGRCTFETELKIKGGAVLPVEISAHCFSLEGTTMVLSTVRDVTHLRMVERELREERQRYRELSTHLQHLREEQLARLARDLHDDLGQSLTALKMHLTVLERDIARTETEESRKKLGQTAEDMKSILTATVARTRELVRELRPTVLDTSGLIEALEWQTEEFSRFSGIKAELYTDIEEIALDNERSLAVFRMVQESLTNVARHSGAEHVSIIVKKTKGLLNIDICDTGRGFEPAQRCSSFGLLGIQERAEFCRGNAEFHSSPGAGTKVKLQLPLENGQ